MGVLASEPRPQLCDVAEQTGSGPRWLPNELCRPRPSVPRGLALRGLRLSAGLVQVVSGACLPSAVLDGGRVSPCAPV